MKTSTIMQNPDAERIKKLSREVARWIKGQGWSQKQVAEMLGMSRGAGEFGGYWSRSRNEDDADYAYYLKFFRVAQGVSGYTRYHGCCVRPVLVLPL